MNEPSISVTRLNEITKLLAINDIRIDYDKEGGYWYAIKWFTVNERPYKKFDTWLDAAASVVKSFDGQISAAKINK
jgi:hypothetical protein